MEVHLYLKDEVFSADFNYKVVIEGRFADFWQLSGVCKVDFLNATKVEAGFCRVLKA